MMVAPLTASASKKWRVKENCTYVEHPSNDGDSFRVKIGNRTYILRLLWVDAPETDNRFPERVAEQAAYFGITPEDALRIGREATRFTREFLTRQPFTVFTQFENAPGASAKDREYAIVKSGNVYLMEALVSNGLARIHGLEEMPPDGPSVSSMRLRLRALEADAKRNRRGAWALAGAPVSRFEHLNRPPEVAPGRRALSRTTFVYSLEDPARPIGSLRAGAEIEVLGAVSVTDIRIRFRLPDGRTAEGLVRRQDLGL